MNFRNAWLACIVIAAQGCLRWVAPDGEVPVDAADHVSPPPLDAGPEADASPGPVCTTPYGTVPVGGVVSIECDRCTCVAAGDLRCIPTGCVDVPSPPDAGRVCLLPDGRTLLPGTSGFVGCATCFCDDRGSLSCVGTPECDAGPPPPVDAGDYCIAPDGSYIPVGSGWSSGCESCFCGGAGSLRCGIMPGCGDSGPPPPVSCRAPDGTPVPAGGVWTSGCTTCTCSYSGSLACGIRPGCHDAGPPPPTFCRAPDGTPIPAGGSWSSGCSSCYCQYDGSLTCEGLPGCDGGLPDGSVDAGSCNTLSLAGVRPPAVLPVGWIAPATGGPIADGLYALTRMEFTGPGSPGPVGAMLMEFSSGVMQTASLDPYSPVARNATYWFRTMGTAFQLVPVCGAGGSLQSAQYSATPTDFSLLLGDSTAGSQQRVVFTRR